ncbi:MAG: PQQ-dependent sugar dehydrogenase [Ornithinimicrobium sp.]|uniref:PQQ-dependent sugar dehydrogenase n=1 Tax=Ornithinimicrobium sp. TaxID=1977084 RepID=UPI003D9ADA91
MHPRSWPVLVSGLVLALAACSTSSTPSSAPTSPAGSSKSPARSAAASPGATETPAGAQEPVQVIAQDFDVPWGLAVLDDGDVLVGERDTARVWRVVAGGEPQPVTTVPGVEPGGEGGLLGIVVPPGGGAGSFFVYATTETDNRVLHVDTTASTQDGGPLVEVVLDGIPKAGNHNGGRLAFGPDDYLYVTTGDASDGPSAQDPDSLGGKILRITTDGEPAPGNPDPDSPVWSMGHRNVQGLGWDSQGRMWASEFGQNDLDEVNLIEPGGNYGWPQFEGPGGEPEFIDPVLTWPTSQASPSGLALGPDGELYVAALRGQALWRVPVDEAGEAGEPERLLTDYGRLRSVVVADGALWVLTSNTFRGDPADTDDRLLRVTDLTTLTP